MHLNNLKSNLFFDEDLDLWRRFISPNYKYMVDKFTNEVGRGVSIKELLTPQNGTLTKLDGIHSS